MESVRQFLLQRPPGPLFHYTDAAGLLGILQTKEIWASSALHLNDADEFKAGLNVFEREVEDRLKPSSKTAKPSPDLIEFQDHLTNLTTEDKNEILVASFSEHPDQLSQWRAYCPNSSGFSIGFEAADLARAGAEVEFFLVKCVYKPDEKAQLIALVAEYLERGFRKAKDISPRDKSPFGRSFGLDLRIRAKAVAVMLALKHAGFQEEREWRLVGWPTDNNPLKFRPGRFGVVPYCALALCKPEHRPKVAEIYVGPNAEPEVAEADVIKLCEQYTARNEPFVTSTKVVRSGIPFRY